MWASAPTNARFGGSPKFAAFESPQSASLTAPLAKGSQGAKGSHRAAKYHNERAERNGVKFDSRKQARRYDELMVMLRAGIISDLRLEPQFTLQESYMTETGERIRAVRYTADFSYKFGGKLVVEDVKSKPTRTKEYLRNRKFMRSKFGIDIQEV